MKPVASSLKTGFGVPVTSDVRLSPMTGRKD